MQTAAGELEGGYRRIVQVLQGNPLAPTGKSLRGYRRISYGAEAWSALMSTTGRQGSRFVSAFCWYLFRRGRFVIIIAMNIARMKLMAADMYSFDGRSIESFL